MTAAGPWSTGRPVPSRQGRTPRSGRSSSRRTPVAFARLRGVDPSLVDAAFFYAAEGVTVRPAVPDERILVAMLSTIPD